MRSILLTVFIMAFCHIANCQDNSNLIATIAGYKSNDTIRISDCSELSEITLNNKDYSVISFTMFYSDSGYDLEIGSNSSMITDQMRNVLSKTKLKQNETKFFAIKDIRAQSAKSGQVKINDLYFRLKMD
jgi:hypothetical protein